MTEATCLVCHRREAPVCAGCRTRMAGQLDSLPDLLDRLTYALVPGPGGGERVAASREAPLPLRLAALTLTAGGSDDARCAFVPKVVVWSTVVDVADEHGTVTQVPVWHRELARDATGRPVMTLADDQTGVLPIKAWLAAWELDWRRQFGHALRPAESAAAALTDPRRYPTLAERSRTLLGLGSALMPAERPADPVAAEWELRWPAARDPHLAADLHRRYLVTWLAYACENHPNVGDFAASLRAVVGAARAALGDTDDLQYLGRCPEDVDRDGGPVVCGAALWHDPHASMVTCPRCHAETGEQHLVWLARRILDVWPIDARRRYPRGLIEILRLPACGGCGAPVVVTWIDATERADKERFWRPGRVLCSAGCDQPAVA